MPEPMEAPPQESRPDALQEIVWYRDAKLDTASHYVIKGFLDASAFAMTLGLPGCGKTFFQVDVACHVAANLPWRERKVRGGPVLYLAAEAGRSLLRRVVAWRTYHDLSDIPLAVRTAPVDLLRPDADTTKIVALCNAIKATAGAVVLIVIDTVARAMPGGKENTPEDMGAFVANCDRIRAETGAAVMGVHHLGKETSRGSRGHNSLPAAIDTEITIADHIATVTKARDAVAGTQMAFKLEVVDLGIDDDGDAITSCVAVETETVAQQAVKATKLSAPCAIALAALREALASAGEIAPASNHIPDGVAVVSKELWRRYAYEKNISDGSTDAKQKAFKRASQQLQARGVIGCWGDSVWVAP